LKKSKKITRLIERVEEAGGKVYAVGGYVRDLVLGRDPQDLDLVAVGISHTDINEIAWSLDGCVAGKDFPVYIVDGVEVALARTERKTAPGHSGFNCNTKDVTLEQDLSRRDLTINAMAMDLSTNKIIDPHGGIEDIEDGVLMPVGKHFSEDPLRVVRAARFAAQLEMVVGEALVLAAEDVLHELPQLPGERVF
jgi:tRNA nucleotidyltransferase (CCA-adding enzyme)